MRIARMLAIVVLAVAVGLTIWFLVSAPRQQERSPQPPLQTQQAARPPAAPHPQKQAPASTATPTNLLRVGTWDLAWFGGGTTGPCPNEVQFPRSEAVIQALAKYIDSLNLDILALQGVQDEQAMDRLLAYLPAEKYSFIVSSEAICRRLAILYRQGSVDLQLDSEISAMAVAPDLPKGLVARVLLLPENVSLLVVVVQLQSGAAETARLQQLKALNAWVRLILSNSEEDHNIIILGDFNAELRRRPDLFSLLAAGSNLRLLTQTLPPGACDPPGRVSTEPVEGLVVTPSLSTQFSGTVRWVNVFQDAHLPEQLRDRFSDHCPLWAEFKR